MVEPIVLGARIVDHSSQCRCCCSCCDIPLTVTDSLNGTLSDCDEDGRTLAVSLGLFSVVRLVRPGQLLVQATEFCLPDKECCEPDEEDPCGTFRKMPFPTAEFCPVTTPLSTPSNGNGNGRSSRCCGNS